MTTCIPATPAAPTYSHGGTPHGHTVTPPPDSPDAPTDAGSIAHFRQVMSMLVNVLSEAGIADFLHMSQMELDGWLTGLKQIEEQFNSASTEIRASMVTEFGGLVGSAVKFFGGISAYRKATTSTEQANALTAIYTGAGDMLSHLSGIASSAVRLTAEQQKVLASTLKMISDFLTSQGQNTGQLAQQVDSIRTSMLQTLGEANTEVYNVFMSL